MKKTRTIKIDTLARVEGEGSLFLRVKNGKISSARLKIFEPPRFFEAFLRGRSYEEAPDLTSRICGICPVAYQMSAVHAIEDIFGFQASPLVRSLRRLLYCGEWIESHALHVYLLHAPDFLGYDGAAEMAGDYPSEVERGLQLKKAGNAILEMLGGRSVHPINVRVGGFYRIPSRKDILPLVEILKKARKAAIETVRWTASFPFPDFERDYLFVSLRHTDEYPMNEGRVVSGNGLNIPVKEFSRHFEEQQVSHSTALHSVFKGSGIYFAGPLARYNLNYDLLPPSIKKAAGDSGVGSSCRNPFKSVIVRSLEILYACEEALEILTHYDPSPSFSSPRVKGVEGEGCAITEAPRGILYHHYRVDRDGLIQSATIIPPTSQNQKVMEEDLAAWAGRFLDLPDEKLRWKCEQAIRNYDPCLSCSTHYLKLHVDRSDVADA
ncbi:MAG: Ni/Fe hydrogenase subunit alpha [Nitrospiria bacterium]